MEQLAFWLKRLVVVVLVAGFLEMILPSNELKSATKLVMGLVIITILLQPMLMVLNIAENFNWPVSESAFSTDGELPLEQVVQEGLLLREDWKKFYQGKSQQVMEEQIRRVTVNNGGDLQELELEYSGEKLQGLTMLIKAREKINSSGDLTREIVGKVSLITGLTEKQIEVIWDG